MRVERHGSLKFSSGPPGNGQVQSTLVVPPLTLVARKAGLRELADLGELGFPSSSGSFVVMQSTIERNPKEIHGVLRAVARAIRIYKTDKDAAIKALSRFMKLEDREALEETWRKGTDGRREGGGRMAIFAPFPEWPDPRSRP